METPAQILGISSPLSPRVLLPGQITSHQ